MTVKTKEQREREVLTSVIRILEERLNPERILLFGSRAKRTTFKGNPDFDLAVDGEKPDFRLMREIDEEIDEAAGLYKVDIVFLSHVDEQFRDIILKTGKVVYVRGS